jgi:hypothetical protein
VNQQDYRAALANLRKHSRLETKMAAIEVQMNNLAADQFSFDEDAFNAALRDHQTELDGEILP